MTKPETQHLGAALIVDDYDKIITEMVHEVMDDLKQVGKLTGTFAELSTKIRRRLNFKFVFKPGMKPPREMVEKIIEERMRHY